MSLRLLLVLNFGVAAFLTGLVWTVQLVHYPGFGLLGRGEFARYHAAHTRRMGYVAAPAMLAELGLAAWLAWAGWRPLGPVAAGAQLGLALLTWLVTFRVSVPFHNRLERSGYDFVAIDGLTRTNWLRTLAWTARAGLLGWWLAG